MSRKITKEQIKSRFLTNSTWKEKIKQIGVDLGKYYNTSSNFLINSLFRVPKHKKRKKEYHERAINDIISAKEKQAAAKQTFVFHAL